MRYLHRELEEKDRGDCSKEGARAAGSPQGERRDEKEARQVVLPLDQNAGALPRQTWIDVCAVFASVLHRDPPQEPAKDETAPLRPIALQRPSQ